MWMSNPPRMSLVIGCENLEYASLLDSAGGFTNDLPSAAFSLVTPAQSARIAGLVYRQWVCLLRQRLQASVAFKWRVVSIERRITHHMCYHKTHFTTERTVPDIML